MKLACREPEALLAACSELGPELAVRRAMQFAFYEQWHALRLRCAQRSIRVVGDIAIFVDYDSADVWAHRDLYRLKEDLEPEVVSGVPPDAFSATGQRWGNPLYNWEVMQSRGYRWWIQRLRWATQTCDYIRLDHFRGFEQFWEIPASEPTAMHGRWVDGPKDDLFNKLREALGGLPFFAEDLGYITPEVHALRERHQIPGLAVLQFGFGNRGAHIYLPHRVTADCVIYTGTHDNDTTLGWWERRGRVRAPCHSNLRRTERRWHSLGPHPPGARFGRQPVGGPVAGCSWSGQRSPPEYSERPHRQFSLALPARIADPGAGRASGQPRRSYRSPASSGSRAPGRRLRRLMSRRNHPVTIKWFTDREEIVYRCKRGRE